LLGDGVAEAATAGMNVGAAAGVELSAGMVFPAMLVPGTVVPLDGVDVPLRTRAGMNPGVALAVAPAAALVMALFVVAPAATQAVLAVGVTTWAGTKPGVDEGVVPAVPPLVDGAAGATVAVTARAGMKPGVVAAPAVVVTTVVGTLVAMTVAGTVVETPDGACASITAGSPRVPSRSAAATTNDPATRCMVLCMTAS
jgi:hypothetical protein